MVVHIKPQHEIELGDPLLHRALQASVGHPAAVTLAPVTSVAWEGKTPLLGRFARVQTGCPVISIPTTPRSVGEADVLVRIPRVGLTFESGLSNLNTKGTMVLTHPYWAMLENHRRTMRVPVFAEIRYGREGAERWCTGRMVDLSIYGCRLRLSEQPENGTNLAIRLPVPGLLVPLLLKVQVVWSRWEGSWCEVGCEFLSLPLQVESALVRSYDLPRPLAPFWRRGK